MSFPTKKQEIDTALDNINRRRKEIRADQIPEPDWDALDFTRDEFEALTFTEKRALIGLILREIKIFSGHAILVYRFPRNAKGDPTARVNLPAPKRQHHKKLPKKFTALPPKNE